MAREVHVHTLLDLGCQLINAVCKCVGFLLSTLDR